MAGDLARAAALSRQGELDEAAATCEAILAAANDQVDALHLLAVIRLRQGRPEEARALLERAIRRNPELAEAHYHLAHAQRRLGQREEVVQSYRRALEIRPAFAEALFNLGNALGELGRREEAAQAYQRFLEIRPGVAEGHRQLAATLGELGRAEEAVQSYRRALELRPDRAAVHFDLGVTLRRLGHDEEAAQCYRRAVEIAPGLAVAHNNLGVVLREQRRTEDALASFRRAVDGAPDLAEAHDNLGAVLNDLGRHEEAVASHRQALRLRPEMVGAHYNLGCALAGLARHEEAIGALQAALRLQPDHVAARFALTQLYWSLDRLDETVGNLQRVLEINPDHPYAHGALAFARRRLCDWSTAEDDIRTLTAGVRAGRPQVRPFPFLALSDDPADHLRCATAYTRDRFSGHLPPVRRPPRDGDGRIRLGYLSADFRENPLSWLMAELFELHDRRRFAVSAFSLGPDDGSALRRRVVRAFDRFHDLRGLGHRQSAELMATEVDIAIDLNGHSQLARPQILALRPAPVQVSYIGFPSTMGAGFIDYILVDRFVVPPDQACHFTERLVHLPDCYQVNDRTRAIADATPSRAECGLPARGFVFCCFNQNFKITPQVFAVWMRLLAALPRSVLWLMRNHPVVETNLRREAAARGVDPDRLVFAPFVEHGRHLARHRHADLFLDTLPYGAHTTASDALWAGLPVLTCAGRSFAARVGGSLLRAVGLDELITTSLDEYEAAALALARDPARLDGLRRKLADNRSTMPLFDTERQRRSLERAYGEMWRRHERGLPPAAFAVPAEDPSG